MAIRLNVIIVHSPPAIPGAQQLAESLVGELIGRPGIDVALVESLSGISESSTDALTLESITGDVAVLDWRSPADLVQALAALQFVGTRAPHANDPGGNDPSANDPGGSDPQREEAVLMGRKIYAFDLQTHTDAKQLCNDLQALLATRRVQTFAIGGRDSGASPAAEQPDAVGTTVRKPITRAARNEQPSDQANPPADAPDDAAVASPVESRAASSQSSATASNTTSIDLDALVDELDLLDP
jgi:hypothetical protein